MNTDTTDITVEDEDGGHVGRLTVLVDGDSKADVLSHLAEIQAEIENLNSDDPPQLPEGEIVEDTDDDGGLYEDTEAVEPANGGLGGTPGHKYRVPDEDVEVVEDEDGVLAVTAKGAETRRVAPENKEYWVLWHVGHYQTNVGEEPTMRDLETHYPHLDNVSGAFAALRRGELVEAIPRDGATGDPDADPLYKASYRVTDAGTKYLRRHGEPVGRELP